MAYNQLLTRTTSDPNAAADVNTLQDNIEALKGGSGATAPTTDIESLKTQQDTNTTNISTNTSDISDLDTNKLEKGGYSGTAQDLDDDKLNIADIDDTPADEANVPVSSQYCYGAITGERTGWRGVFNGSSTYSVSSPTASTWQAFNSISVGPLDAGTYDVYFHCTALITYTTYVQEVRVGLSDENTSGVTPTYLNMIDIWNISTLSGATAGSTIMGYQKQGRIELSTSKTLYLKIRTVGSGSLSNIQGRGDLDQINIIAQRRF